MTEEKPIHKTLHESGAIAFVMVHWSRLTMLPALSVTSQVRVNNGTWRAAAGWVSEAAYGLYYYHPTPDEQQARNIEFKFSHSDAADAVVRYQ